MKISLGFKKLLSFILTFSIILSLLPSFALIANAAKQTSILDEQIIIDYSQDIKISGNKVTLSAKASSFIGTASKTNTFYFINNTDDMIELSFDYTASNCTGFSWGGSGKKSFVLDKGEETDAFTITAQASSFSSVTAELILSNVSVRILRDSVVTFKYNESMGVVTSNGSIIPNDSIVNVDSKGLPVKVAANEGYLFFGWKIISEGNSGEIFSYDSDTTLSFNGDVTVEAVFISSTTALFGVGSERFYNLNDACVFASSGSTKTVVLLNNGTVSGAHTIPSGVTLLIPFNGANTVYTSSPECTSSLLNNKAWEQPYAYRTLTLAADANITVNGNISVSAQHAASNGGGPYSGAPTGPVGWVKMLGGSKITLNSGANLYAWGYIQGGGEIIAKSGAHIYENFQFTDFRGGTNTSNLIGDGLVFPVNQYYIQNIEVCTKYEAGAKETLYASVYSSSMVMGGNAPFIGEGGMFVVKSGYVVKDYIENSDRMLVEVHGDVEMSSMKVSVGFSVDSSEHVLPLTNNITIDIVSGTTTVKQSVALLPGVEMKIQKDAILDIGASTAGNLNNYNSAGYHLIVYDKDEWFYGLDLNTGDIVENRQYAFNSSIVGIRPLVYAPGRTYNRTANDIKDAVLDVNGKIIVNGNIYTTKGGANIISSEKTGEIQMISGAGTDERTFQAQDGTAYGIPINTASLMNEDGSYLETTGTVAGTTYYYNATCNMWVTHAANGHGDVTTDTDHDCDACGALDVTVHEYSSDWKTDENDHWHECNCGDRIEVSAHADNEKNDHLCDVCLKKISDCYDSDDADHLCDYCNEKCEDCYDSDENHYCDECAQKTSDCKDDSPRDHLCDYKGCKKALGECSDSDTDNDHVCDYGCGAVLEECKDTDTDNDHNCDICGKQNVTEHDYTYGEYVWNDDFSSCTRTRTCNCTYSETAIATITSIVKSPATCEGKGWTTYTAMFTEDWAETQTKDVEDIEPLGHRFTNESDSECDFCEYTRAAYIGDVSYVTFEDALAAAKEGDTIVVLSQIVIEGERSLDLTGITLDSKYINFDDYAMVVRGDLTIVGGTFNFENYYGIGTTANGKLTINGGKYSTTKDYYLIGNFGETVINDGEFTSLYCNVNSFDGTVIINGGRFTVTDYSYPDYPPCDVFAEEKGEAIINGGNFSTDVSEHCPEGHTIKDVNDRYPFENHSYDSVVTDPTCTVEGKTTHTCECGDSYDDTIVAATGHSYDDDFDATCNNGCGHVREAKILVAMIGNTKFDSLSEAVNTAKDGETIVLCKDVTLTEKLVVATTQKWDFGSYTVTLANGDENYSLVVKGDLTIESGTFVVSGWYGIGVTGKLTVNNGKIEYSGYNDYLIGNWGETVINGGVFDGQYCCVNNFSGTTVINDGKFTTEMKDSTGDYDSCDLFADSGLSVNGGNFSKDVTIYCDNDHHTCDVDGDGGYVYEKHCYDSVVTDPTCTEEGYTTYTCHCGDSYVGDYVDANGHDYAEKVTDPTCTEEGYTTYTCHCGDSYVGDYVNANGHDHGSFGYDLYKHWSICSVEGCGTIFDEEAHDFINDACKCGAKRVSVNKVGNSEIDYTVTGQTVTVTHEDACTVAYIVDGKYVKLEAVENIDGSYSFTAPDGVENVALLVIGDYDADGVLTEEDAYSLRNAILGKETLNDTPEFVYDVNGDQKITALDLALISAAAQRSIKLG